ncbi:MAG: ribosomal RNA adenine methylase transferase [Parcubacteria group bacterium Gr01-1014_72]|nr:MAG: ribosomal RNA adenine methylase transferase [Parcubacteria group bacterium Gr01-1014_72]
MEKVLFIKEFLKNWREVGSITPSSRFLVRKMLEPIDFIKAKVIVELGPGSGCFTRVLLRNMREDSRLIVFEKNKDFCVQLEKIDDRRLTIRNDPAIYLGKYLEGINVDYITSGIPLANMPPDDTHALLSASYRTLSPQGIFIQFQYSLKAKKDLENVFDEVSLGFTLFNIPPAFIYSCLKK